MPAQARHTTKYPGVYYIIGTSTGTRKPDRIYYIDYRKDGKRVQEKAGRASQNMTPAKAAHIRATKIEGKVLSNKEQRKAEEAARAAEAGRWTIGRLWNEYRAGRKPGKGLDVDTGRYEKYLKPAFENVEPKDILFLVVERFKRKALKGKSPQTKKHVLNLLTWIINYGVKGGLCIGAPIHIKKPTVDNQKTEGLTDAQLKRLLTAIAEDDHPQAGNMMLMALYCGLRRGEMFKLEWSHIDFERGFMTLVGPKGGKNQQIKLNRATRKLLDNIPRQEGSPFVFPGRAGKQRTEINRAVAKIKQRAELPKDFRPLHGLRHVFASTLANSGEVDMYVLQKLLTHKDPRMTQRYAHLSDETLDRASNLAGDYIESIETDKDVIKLHRK